METLNPGFHASLLLACALAAFTGYAAEPVRRLPQQDVVPLPKLETARLRAEHEEIAAWYEREAASAEERAAAHRRMRDANAYYPDYGDAGFAGHCENLIQRYQQAAEGNLALAGLHRRLAGDANE